MCIADQLDLTLDTASVCPASKLSLSSNPLLDRDQCIPRNLTMNTQNSLITLDCTFLQASIELVKMQKEASQYIGSNHAFGSNLHSVYMQILEARNSLIVGAEALSDIYLQFTEENEPNSSELLNQGIASLNMECDSLLNDAYDKYRLMYNLALATIPNAATFLLPCSSFFEVLRQVVYVKATTEQKIETKCQFSLFA